MSNPILFYTTSTDANFLALTDFHVPDPVIMLSRDDKKPIVVVSSLEFGRASKNNKIEVILDTTLGEKLV